MVDRQPVMVRGRLALALAAVVASACAAPQPIPTARPSAGSPSATVPSIGASAPFWLQPPLVAPGIPSSTCGYVAVYAISGGPPIGLGGCAMSLSTTPATTTLHVGQALDLHMTSTPGEGGPSATAGYPLPASPDEAILRRTATSDNGTTGTFEALAPGTVVLGTTGLCLDVIAGTQVSGPCAVLRVQIMP